MTSLLYADTVSAGSAQAPSPLVSFVPLLVIFVIFYFLLIRPQQKKMKVHQKMVDGIKKGDSVITSGGLYAKVVSVGDTTVEVKIADNVQVKMLKSAVSEVAAQENAAAKTGETIVH